MHFYISEGANGYSGVVLPDSLYSQAKPIYEHGNCLYYRKPDGSFRDNIRVSVIVCRVSVFVYE